MRCINTVVSMMNLVGRRNEIAELERLYASKRSEFVAVYGRRRVGKTFLIKEVFKDRFTFWHTGLSPYGHERKFQLHDQLQAFFYSLHDYGFQGRECPKSWLEAFRMLEQLLESRNDGKRQVVFIDELPWMDTARSRFIAAFEHFWNGWASKRDNIMLIVCGSATSWIANNLINNKGGLYNRLTCEMKIRPFCLGECAEYFRRNNLSMSHYDVVQAYMVFGGIPHYLSLFAKGYSAAQNIDRLLFDRNAKLRNEFDRLFESLFKNADDHKKVVRLLAERRGGYTRNEILERTGIKNGGDATNILKGLVESDFVVSYFAFGERRVERYRLTDHFCLAYMHFFAPNKAKPGAKFWQKNSASPRLNAWRGFAFEELCFAHIDQIKQKLGIAGVSTNCHSWVLDGSGRKHQIDLLIDRSDNVVNLCEIKFYGKPFAIDKHYDAELRARVQTLMDSLSQKKSVHLTLIASYGLKPNIYSGQVQSEVRLEDLFEV